MNMHTKEPWKVNPPHNTFSDSWRIFEGSKFIASVGNSDFPDESKPTAERIVACVNALAGIPTEALEAGVIGEAVGALDNFALTLYQMMRKKEGNEVTIDVLDWNALQAAAKAARTVLAKLKGVRA